MKMKLLRITLSAGLIFGVIMGSYQGFLFGFAAGARFGAIFGLMFGLITAFGFHVYSISMPLDEQVKLELPENEAIIFDSKAGHIKTIETVSGHLYLTNERLVFCSGILNVQRGNTTILLSEIDEVSSFKTLGFINNGLLIKTKKGGQKFAVSNNKMWLDSLHQEY